MSVISSALLRWVRGESTTSLWHLTFDGRNVLCGAEHWGGPPLRPLSRDLKGGAPDGPCRDCQREITRQLGLSMPVEPDL